MIRLSKLGVKFSGSRRELNLLRDEFARRNHIRLKHFLDPDLLKTLQSRAYRAKFRKVIYPGVGYDESLVDEWTEGLIRLLLNGEDLFHLLHKISNCGPIKVFGGRIYRFVPGKRSSFGWHNDHVDKRLLAITINLSETPYVGGCLRLRRAGRGNRILSVPNTGLGDAVVFRISDRVEHRVTALRGKVTKTALAGWFYADTETK